MNYILCSVYDEKAGIYAPPFATINAATALRMFAQLANDATTQVGRHPADFHLYEIGTYDDQLGLVEPLVAKVNLGRADQLVQFAPAGLPHFDDGLRAEQLRSNGRA